jgi:hypothetical protein
MTFPFLLTVSLYSSNLLNSRTDEEIMMSDHLQAEPSLDLGRLRQAIQEEYAAVARDPGRGYHFHTGRPLASLLGYHDDWLEGLPEGSIASFAGTGNPFRISHL